MNIIIRKSNQRGLTKTSWLESYHSFSFGEYFDPEFNQFGVLRVLNEDFIGPQKGFHAHGHKDIEIISYVIEGSLSHHDNMGYKKTLIPGDIQYISAGKGILHSEMNTDKENKSHFIQIWVTPQEKGLNPHYHYRHIGTEEGQKEPMLLFSPDGKMGSIPIHQNIEISILRLAPKERYSFAQPIYKMCWIQVVQGSLTVQEENLEMGDGIGLKGHGEISLLSDQKSEVWIFSMRHEMEF